MSLTLKERAVFLERTANSFWTLRQQAREAKRVGSPLAALPGLIGGRGNLGAHLEHDRREPHALDRIPHGGTFVGQLLERRADENSHALVRGSDGHHHHNHRTNRRPLGSTLFHAHAVPWPRNAPTLHGRGLS